MARRLWQNNTGQRWRRSRKDEVEFKEFSVLGKRFAYQPDDMALYELGYSEKIPQVDYVMQPQFELGGVRPGMLVLLPTLGCNLACGYCFEQGCAQEGRMSLSTAHKAMQLIGIDSKATIAFFGGEPLLEWELLVQAVAHAKKRFAQPAFSLTSNGTLMDAQKAAFLEAHNFSLIISIDGPQHLHDMARPMKNGEGSYEKVIRGLEALAGHKALAARTTLRATFDGSGRHSHLVERVKHLNDLADRYGLGNVSVEPADMSEGCGQNGVAVEPDEALYEEYMELACWYVQKRRAGEKVRFHHFDVRMRRLQNRSPAPSECGAGVGYLAVTPGGDLHACHRMGCKVGDVESGIQMALQQPWRDNRYYARAGCGECWLRNVCGGGCRLNSCSENNDIKVPEGFGCWLTETCVKAAAYILAMV